MPGLFGNWSLVREWGRLGSPGTLRKDWFATEDLAKAAYIKLIKNKQKKGYELFGNPTLKHLPAAQ